MGAKIPDLPLVDLPLAGTEELEIVQDEFSKRITQADLVGAIAPLLATYVTVTANATLPNERILAGEASVVTITDGGAGANITVSLDAGGVVNAKLADMVQATFKGRADGAGTGVPVDLTAAQAATIIGSTGLGYFSLSATGRVIGSDAGSANVADDVIIGGRAAAVLMADADFAGSIVFGADAWSRATGAATAPFGTTVVIGQSALLNCTSALTGSSVVIGSSAMESSSFDNTNSLLRSVVLGFQAGQQQGDNPAANSVVIGYRAGRCGALANASINGQVFIGALAGQGQNTAANCTAVGTDAMSLATLTGSENSCFGKSAGLNLAGGANNTCLGSTAGTGLSSESDNVMVGQSIAAACAESVLLGNQTSTFGGGTGGISLGHLAGRNLVAGDGQLVIESIQSSGLNRISFLYGEMDLGNLALGAANSGGGLPPVNRDFGTNGENVFKIHDTPTAPTTAATAGATLYSDGGILNIWGGVTNRGETRYLGTNTPAALGAGVTNNWAPSLTGATRIELEGGAAAEITGLVGGTDGRYLILTNIGATNNVIIRDEDALSTAANRFSMNGDLILGLSESASFIYSTTISRWTRVNNA